MLLPRTINNSVEFRSGPSHLKMIMLGRPTFEVVMAFARWHATARATLPRDGFLHETSMPSVTLVKGGCVQTKLVFGKRAREDTC
jgi:hypothetical protein|eukprot:3222144-Prymnesium_polylepis.2